MCVYEDFSPFYFFYVAGMPSKIKKKYNLQAFNACKVLMLNVIAKC